MRKGHLVLTTDLSRKLDDTCEIWANHVCHEMQSKAAAALLEKMEENLYDPALGMKSKMQLDYEERNARAERRQKSFERELQRQEKQRKRAQLRAVEVQKERLDQQKREDKRKRDRKRRKEARLEAERRKTQKESMMQHRKSEKNAENKESTGKAYPW